MSKFKSRVQREADPDSELDEGLRQDPTSLRERLSGIARQAIDKVVETIDQVQERIGRALGRAQAWWSGHQHLTTPGAPLNVPHKAVAILSREDEALMRKEQELRLSERQRIARVQQVSVEITSLTQKMEAERRHVHESERKRRDRVSEERIVATRIMQSAEAEVKEARDQKTKAERDLASAEKKSAPGRARVSRTEKRARKDKTSEQAEGTRSKGKDRTHALIREATYPIPWVKQVEIAGVRPIPMGKFYESVQMPSPHSRVVGARGRLDANIDWSKKEAIQLATVILDSQGIDHSRRGGQVKHVAHAVLSKPNDGKVAAQKWTDDSAMRASRHYLVGQGADPDRHDSVIFVHSQVERKSDGSFKVEEAVHILWSRVRDDGLLHKNDHAFVSAAVARARYDVYAGIDPERIGMASTKSRPVRDGMAALSKGALSAYYVDPETMKKVEKVPLQGLEFAQCLAAEGHPEQGDIAGTWTPKPCYSMAKYIRRILAHLMGG